MTVFIKIEYNSRQLLKEATLIKKTPKQKKALGYTKTLSIFVLIVVVEVILFAEYEMHRLRDLTALYVLIGATVTTGFAYFIGLLNKHAKENTKGGIIYETAMLENHPPIHESDPEERSYEL